MAATDGHGRSKCYCGRRVLRRHLADPNDWRHYRAVSNCRDFILSGIDRLYDDASGYIRPAGRCRELDHLADYLERDCAENHGERRQSAAADELSHAIALLDLHRAIVDRGEHLGGITRDDNVNDGRAVALFHTLTQRRG